METALTGIEFSALLRFLVQAGFAVSGASALWSFVLRLRAPSQELAELIAKLFFSSIALFLLLWWFAAFFVFLPQGMAHEGIKLDPTLEEIMHGYQQNVPFVAAITLLTLSGLLFWRQRRALFERYAQAFFAAQFCLLTLVPVAAAWQGALNVSFFSSFFHNWHSILTFGTVVSVDLLYLFTLHKHHLQKIVYPFFPIMSATIWIGLGLDFLSAGLVFTEAFMLWSQFYFVQTCIAVIIINGALLSGKITDKLNEIARSPTALRLSKRLQYIFGLSGAVSIVSWATITFLDFFEFPFSYGQFLLFYAVAIMLAYFAHLALEKLFERSIMSE